MARTGRCDGPGRGWLDAAPRRRHGRFTGAIDPSRATAPVSQRAGPGHCAVSGCAVRPRTVRPRLRRPGRSRWPSPGRSGRPHSDGRRPWLVPPTGGRGWSTRSGRRARVPGPGRQSGYATSSEIGSLEVCGSTSAEKAEARRWATTTCHAWVASSNLLIFPVSAGVSPASSTAPTRGLEALASLSDHDRPCGQIPSGAG
jgi:hypothetical protein